MPVIQHEHSCAPFTKIGPWKPDPKYYEENQYLLLARDPDDPCLSNGIGVLAGLSDKDASHVVRCLNAYDPMVEALLTAKEVINGVISREAGLALNEIREALRVAQQVERKE